MVSYRLCAPWEYRPQSFGKPYQKEVPDLDERRTPQSQETAVHARRKPRRRADGAARGVFMTLLTLILIGCCATAMLFGIFMKYVNTSLLPTLDVKAEDYTMAQSSVVYYQDKDSGQWVEYQKVHGQENRVLVDIGDMSPYLWQAAVSIEDERFFSHHGVDWKRTLGATVKTLVGSNDSYGGSTITQQMLKNMTGENQNTINRKVKEIFRALEFEKDNTKSQILELYLNMIYLGSGCNGVETAAEYYFGKSAKDLTAAESACIIAITNNPSLYNPKYDRTYTRKDGTTITPRELNKQRQELILDKMSKVINPDTGKPYLTKEECEAAKAEPLNFTDTAGDASNVVQTDGIEINNWFVEQLIKDVTNDLAEAKGVSYEAAQRLVNNSGYQIYCTMDPEIQEIAEGVYEDASNLNVHSASGKQLQSGITIMDPYTGNIVAMVGAVGPKTQNLVDNYAVQKHQVGSSIKPLTVYSAALDAGAVTPATTFDNYPVHLLNGNPWPKNSPNTYTGWTMIGEGVRRSINTIAVQTLEALGVADSYAYATEKLGLSLVPEDMGVAPLAMGGLTYGLSTVEMAAAFSSFANSGVYNSPKMYTEVRDSNGEVVLKNEGETHAAMKETTAYFMNQMLTSVVNAGTGTSAKFSGMTIAGKTGTTNDSRVRYFVGYTPYYCAAVWTGYPSTNEKISASGNPAITMWKPIMQKIHENLENKSFPTPSSGLETVTVCADSGKRCTDACLSDIRGSRAVTVTVAAGTAPTERCDKHVFVDYCTEGKCLATDSCPADHVKQVGVLDFERTDYFNGGSRILATDSAKNPDSLFHLTEMKRAIGLLPTPTASGGETYPEVIGCPVHAGMTPEEPDNPAADPTDPNDPNYNPPADDTGNGDDGGEPAEPPIIVPVEPSEPDSSGGFGDAGSWAASFFNN